jgi:hypothetical protein
MPDEGAGIVGDGAAVADGGLDPVAAGEVASAAGVDVGCASAAVGLLVEVAAGGPALSPQAAALIAAMATMTTHHLIATRIRAFFHMLVHSRR